MRTRLPFAVCAVTAAVAVSSAPAAAQDAAFYGGGEQPAFAAAVADRGLQVDLAEDFEDAKPSPGFLGLPILAGPPTGPIDDPLDSSGGGPFFAPGQIPAHLRIQSNTDNSGVSADNPVGSRGLAISRPGSAGDHGSPTTISSPFQQGGPVSTDILAVNGGAPEAYALDLSLVEFSFVEPGTDPIGGPLKVQAFDTTGAALGTTTIDQTEIGPFLGVLAPAGRAIGRVNVSEPGGSELIHSVVAYDADGGGDMGTPAPASNLLGDILEALGLG